jgi:hypothetical protein
MLREELTQLLQLKSVDSLCRQRGLRRRECRAVCACRRRRRGGGGGERGFASANGDRVGVLLLLTLVFLPLLLVALSLDRLFLGGAHCVCLLLSSCLLDGRNLLLLQTLYTHTHCTSNGWLEDKTILSAIHSQSLEKLRYCTTTLATSRPIASFSAFIRAHRLV